MKRQKTNQNWKNMTEVEEKQFKNQKSKFKNQKSKIKISTYIHWCWSLLQLYMVWYDTVLKEYILCHNCLLLINGISIASGAEGA